VDISNPLLWIAIGIYAVAAWMFQSWLKWYLNTQGRGSIWPAITPWDENYLDKLIRESSDPRRKAWLKRLRLLHYALLVFPILVIIAVDCIDRALR